RDPELVPEPAEQRQGLLEELLCPGRVAAGDEHEAESVLRVPNLARRQLLAVGDDCPPVAGEFLRMAAEPPEPPGRRAQLVGRSGLVLVEEPGHRGAEIV